MKCAKAFKLQALKYIRKVKIKEERLSISGTLPDELPSEFRSNKFRVIAETYHDGRKSLLLLMPPPNGHCCQTNPNWGVFGRDAKGKIRYGWWVYEDDCEKV